MQKTREVPAAHNLLSEHFPLTAEVRLAIQGLLGDNTPEPPDIFAIRSKVKELMQSLPSPAQTKSSLEILAATDYLTRLSEIYSYCPHLQEGGFIPFDVDLSPFQSRMRDLGTRYERLSGYRNLAVSVKAKHAPYDFRVMKVKGYEWDDINQQSLELVLRNKAFAKRDRSNKMDHRFSVANFRFLRVFEEETKETWEILHREVSSEYRNQGIASQLLQTIESFLQGRLESTGKEQELVLSVRQADVLIWAIKNGFMPATIKDSERLRRVFAGDEGLTLVSGEGKECWRHYYIFEKDKYYDWDGKPKPEIWWRLGDESFLKTAFTIRLIKTIT